MTSMAAASMPASSRFFERVAEWAGPVVVKEIRTGLKSRAFGVAFGLMLSAGFIVTIVNAVLISNGGGRARGAENFVGTVAAFAFYGHLLMPFIAYRAMVKEREEETWVLLILTGLGTSGIVRGKHLSAMAQLGLGAAATAPFMMLSYLLSGIGLVNVLVGVWWNLGVAVLTTTVAIGLAAQSETSLERTAGHFLVLIFSGVTGGISLAVTGALAFKGERALQDGEVLALFLGLPVFMLAVAWCVLPAAAAALALDSESKSHPARIRLAVVLVGSIVACAVAQVMLNGGPGVMMVPAILGSLVLLVAGIVAFSERPGYPKSAAMDGRERPGAFRSSLLVVLLLGLLAVTFSVAVEASSRSVPLVIAAPSYVALYLSLGYLAGRLTPLRSLGPRNAARIGFVAATTLGVVGPSVIAIIAGKRIDRGPLWGLNPILGVMRFADRGGFGAEAAMLGALTLLVVFVALMVMSGEDGVRTYER